MINIFLTTTIFLCISCHQKHDLTSFLIKMRKLTILMLSKRQYLFLLMLKTVINGSNAYAFSSLGSFRLSFLMCQWKIMASVLCISSLNPSEGGH